MNTLCMFMKMLKICIIFDNISGALWVQVRLGAEFFVCPHLLLALFIRSFVY